MKKSFYNISFTVLLIVIAVLYGALMFSGAVWYDEAYSMAMIRLSFSDICSVTAQDVHPPLYYFMLKCFTAPFGYSLLAAKVFSVLPLLLTMILGYVKLSDIVNKKAGLIFAMMFSLLPIMTMFSVEIRMYGWASFFVTGCGLFAYTAQRDGKFSHFAVSAVFAAAAAYTHYFALVSAGIIYAILLAACIKKHRLKPFFISAAGAVLAYLPWLASFVSQLADKVENEYWIAPITPSVIGNYFKVWFKCGDYTAIYLTGIAVIFALSLTGLLICRNKSLKTAALAAASVFVLTNLIGIGASLAVRPVFIERYAVPALPLLLAACAAGLSLIGKKSLTVLIGIFFALGFTVNYPSAVREEYHASEITLEKYLDDADYEALICYVDSHLYGVLSYYADDAEVYRPKLSKGSPFKNIHALSELDTDNCCWAALFLPKGAAVPDEIAAAFNVDYVREISTYNIPCDMYNLWK